MLLVPCMLSLYFGEKGYFVGSLVAMVLIIGLQAALERTALSPLWLWSMPVIALVALSGLGIMGWKLKGWDPALVSLDIFTPLGIWILMRPHKIQLPKAK